MSAYLEAWDRAERLTACQYCGEERQTGFIHYCVVAFMEHERSIDHAN